MDYSILRSWAGKGDLLLGSASGKGVSLPPQQNITQETKILWEMVFKEKASSDCSEKVGCKVKIKSYGLLLCLHCTLLVQKRLRNDNQNPKCGD